VHSPEKEPPVLAEDLTQSKRISGGAVSTRSDHSSIAFSSKADAGSRDENAPEQTPGALLLIPSKAKML
jgi:hypothetical protein